MAHAALAAVIVAAWRGDQAERAITGLIVEDTRVACLALTNVVASTPRAKMMNLLATTSGVLAAALVLGGITLLVAGTRQTLRRLRPGAVGSLRGAGWRFRRGCISFRRLERLL